jgi:hypothetical protein
MKRKAASVWVQLLAHPATHEAMRSLAQGNDPRGILAGMAGDFLAHEVAKAIGAKNLPQKPSEQRARRAEPVSGAPGVKHRPKVERMDEDDVIDAEFTVINVTPRGAKKAG